MKSTPAIFLCFFIQYTVLSGGETSQDYWTQEYPREEIAPTFSKTEAGDLVLASVKAGTNGHWKRVFPVEGGQS